jgi:glycerol-3-phosphate acyltransferase PlsY
VATWLAVFILSRIVSLSSVLAGLSLPLFMILFKQPAILTVSGVILAILVLLRHRLNLERIFQGKERRIF